ncbi:unnamed protein product [Ilex paraguariensis]|uniref:DNA topoisomerase (ATP-hydrolyzing) n=1 Tax=Ilex paraguariensis TaxID=185542 RepID=A0ABC8V280_9AQUA
MEPMDPWYKGFRGHIEKPSAKEAGVSYTISGVIEEVNETTLRITELPIRKWTQDYNEFLESIMTGNDKIKDPFIKDYREHNDENTVHFEVILSEENLILAKQEGLLKKFKLTTTISTILEEFFHIRLEFYEERKKVLQNNLEMELLKLDNKVRFILGVLEGKIIVSDRKRADLFIELKEKGFTPFPQKTKTVEAVVAGATDDVEELKENSETVTSKGVRTSDYEYLLSMAIGTLTLEKVQELCADRDKLNEEVDDLRKATPKSMWTKDLDALERELDEQDKSDVQAEVARKAMKSKVMTEAGLKASKQAPKNPRKNTKKGSHPESISEPSKTLATSVIETEELKENSETVTSKGVHASDYEYLLSMAIGTLTLEKVQELCADRDKLNEEVDDLKKATPKSMWTKDLDALERELDEQDKSDVQAEVARKAMKSKVMTEAGLKASKQAPKNPRKNTKKCSHPESISEPSKTSATSVIETDIVPEVVKHKGKPGSKKAPVKKGKSSLVVPEDDDDEILELKERLAAYNLHSSPDHSEAMETEVPQVQDRKKEISRRAAAQNKPLSTLTEISDDNDISDEDFELEVVTAPEEQKKGGRKLAEKNSGTSPQKKVTKMRASPFNKKSGSMLGRIGKEAEERIALESEKQQGSSASNSDSAEEMNEAVAPRARPQRVNRGKASSV